jgi:hypothetical protein
MTSTKELCSIEQLNRKELVTHLEGCVAQQREAKSHLVAHLRSVVRKRLVFGPPPSCTPNSSDCLRTLRDIDKACARSQEAEILFEALISKLAIGIF